MEKQREINTLKSEINSLKNYIDISETVADDEAAIEMLEGLLLKETRALKRMSAQNKAYEALFNK